MSWILRNTAVFTPTTDVTVTDSPTGYRHAGPDGSLVVDVPVTGDRPAGQRSGGPSGAGVDVSLPVTTPSGQLAGGPDGSLTVGFVLTDTTGGQRSSGPDGAVTVGVTLTDSPSGLHVTALDGSADVGVSVGADLPSGCRGSGPDGSAAVDLTVTDRPRGFRVGGPDGSPAVGVTVGPDTPNGARSGGPVGVDVEDAFPGVTVTDTPGAVRGCGPDGRVAIDLPVPGDVPVGVRVVGPEGFVGIDILLTDTPSSSRIGGPDGLADLIVGGTDTPAGSRSMGPDGSMGIAVPVAGDTPMGARFGGPFGVLVIGVGADVIAGTASPGGSRSGGPEGIVLLAVLPTRQPYVTPTPLDFPAYSLWVADTRTGRMLWELPAAAFSWSSVLGDIGTIRATLAVESVYASLSEQDERSPRVLLREVLTGPWRFSLVLRWGNNTVWAGPYISMSRTGPASVEVGGAEIGKLLAKRVMVAPAAVSAVDPTADLVLGPYATKGHVAAAILTQLVTGAGNNLPLVVTDPAGSGQDQRVYYGYDLATYWEKIQALSAESDGPEIRFDPQVTAGSDGDYLSWVVRIGSPHVGRNTTTWVFDSDVTSIVGFDGDASNMAFGVWATGNGQARDKLIAHSVNAPLLNVGWPMLESVDTAHSSETVYPLLAAYATAGLAAFGQPVVSYQVRVPVDTDPMVGTYRVGEDFAFDVRGDPVIPDGLYTRRIAGLSGDENSWVTITDANPLPVGST
jgi:hypothetical protein